MNANQTLIQPSPSANNHSNLPLAAQLAEFGILAAMAIFLVKYLVKSNNKLISILSQELEEDNRKS